MICDGSDLVDVVYDAKGHHDGGEDHRVRHALEHLLNPRPQRSLPIMAVSRLLFVGAVGNSVYSDCKWYLLTVCAFEPVLAR